MKVNPPKKALAFLRWFCREDYLEEIEGDLREVFQKQYESSPRKATFQFGWSVIKYFRPGFIKSLKGSYQPISYSMFKSFFKTGWRNLARNQGYSFINIGGLAMGMTVAILIGLWIYDEVSFNKFHKNHDTIGQVWTGATDPESSVISGDIAIPYPALEVLKNNYPHFFKHILPAWWISDYTITVNDNQYTRKGEFIDTGALDMLSLKMLKGSYASLNDPHSIVLSRSTAEAMFGKEDPMNKKLKIDNRMEVQVTGVFEDLPKNSHFSEVQFFSPWSLWVSSNPWIQQAKNDWGIKSFNVYVQLQPNTSMESVNAGIHDLYKKHLPVDLQSSLNKFRPFTQIYAMNDWHLYSEFNNGKPSGGRISYVWLFGIAGIFVLLLACINFVNLSTARSEKRARETGIRKAIGSLRSQLVGQFLTESFLVVALAFLFSVIFVLLSLSWFNQLATKEIAFPFANSVFWGSSIAFMLLTALVAGIYPAFYLSSFQPIQVLKGSSRYGRFATMPRKILVIVQFSVSVMLIIGTIIIYQQIQYARNRPVGYNREGLISVRMTDPAFQGKQDLVRNELMNTGYVESTAFADNPLTLAWLTHRGFEWQGKDPNTSEGFTVCYVSNEYGATVKWRLVEGRDFDKNLASDSTAVIVNEAAVKFMNLKNPVGEYIRHASGTKVKIIGVVKDLIMQSPYEPVKQTIFRWNPYVYSTILVRIKTGASPVEAIAGIEKVFKEIVPAAGFDFVFTDDAYAKKFSQEERIGKLSGIFAALAIFISALGLFGLASYIAEQRTKEIGIRKLLGASVPRLWGMLSKDFVVLVIISCGIAIPLSYYFMDNWLQQYKYHTEISWWVFLITVFGAVLVTLLTVSFQAIKAALMNPVKSLRSD